MHVKCHEFPSRYLTLYIYIYIYMEPFLLNHWYVYSLADTYDKFVFLLSLYISGTIKGANLSADSKAPDLIFS